MEESLMKQIQQETAQRMERELERKMWEGGFNGSKFAGLTGNTCRELDDTGELMDSLRSLAETVHDEAGDPAEPVFSWEMPKVEDYTRQYDEQWRLEMEKMAVFDGGRLALVASLREQMVDGRAMLMRRTADVDPELIRNAEIRALTDPS
jgi:hypothetical protein